MKKIILFICLVLLPVLNIVPFASLHAEAVTLDRPVALCHTQDRQQLRESLMNSMEQAQKSILIFTFTFSDSEMIKLLNKKAEEGVEIIIVIDKEHRLPLTTQGSSKLQILTRQKGEGRVHHKILVVDDQYIWIGSANFTKAAYDSQENLMLGIYSPNLADFLQKEATVFRGTKIREPILPLVIEIEDQYIYLGLLPHDGFPPKANEVLINRYSKDLLLNLIHGADKSIFIAMDVWTDADLANAVKSAHKRGVLVKILAGDFEGIIPDLMRFGIDVRVNNRFSMMHNKFMYADRNILVNGSANWSKSSFTRNDESFIVLQGLNELQQIYLDDYWLYLWPEK